MGGLPGAGARQGFDPVRFFQWRNYWDYSGGVATDLHYHKLVPLLIALDEGIPSRVSAAGGVYVGDGRQVPDMFVMTLEYAAGHTIVLASSVATERALPAVFRGERGTLYADGAILRVVSEDHGTSDPVEDEVIAARDMPDHLTNWLDSIRSRTAPVCDAELGCNAAVAIAMAVQAYREGRTVHRGPDVGALA